jgi:hypothetical protein
MVFQTDRAPFFCTILQLGVGTLDTKAAEQQVIIITTLFAQHGCFFL